MKISVIGLGYVGAVTAVCLAKMGHHVIGTDINEHKIEKLNNGEAPIKEEGLDELLKEALNNKQFIATEDLRSAIHETEASFICVRTPLREDDGLDTAEIKSVCEKIAAALISKRGKRHIVAVRSTIPPGTIEELESLFIKEGLAIGIDVVLSSNPEFLREGSAIKDFFEPSYVVVGSDDTKSLEILSSIYTSLNVPIYKVSTKTAEAIKFINNSWHALEMGFVNEVSSICRKLHMDPKELIEVFSADTKLNLSSYYLKPNMGYGGSCLPKDLGALQHIASHLKVSSPILDAVSQSNIYQIKRAYKVIKQEAEKNGREVGIFGVAFKPGTDDIRGSQIIYIIEKLKSDGFKVKIYDPIIKKEQIENIMNSYRETIYDSLLSELMGVKNFKDLLDDIEKMVSPMDEVLSCKVIVTSAKMKPEELAKMKDYQVLINTRAIINIDKEHLKAKYVEAW